jgi:hypothetical protein
MKAWRVLVRGHARRAEKCSKGLSAAQRKANARPRPQGACFCPDGLVERSTVTPLGNFWGFYAVAEAAVRAVVENRTAIVWTGRQCAKKKGRG